MSKIEELIQEYCPDGVEYFPINDLCKTVTPKIKVKSNDYLSTGRYPVIDQGKKFIGGYTDEDGAFADGCYIIFGDHTCVVKYIDFPFVQGADGVKVLSANEKSILPRYLYYCMDRITLPEGYARHWSKMKTQEIPVPPLPVQQEIVRIFDVFTKMEESLNEELELRKKQYENYRDNLLSLKGETGYKKFDELIQENCPDGVEYRTITDCVDIHARVGWQALTRKEYLNKGDYYLITGTDVTSAGKVDFSTCVYVSKARFDMDEKIKIHKDDILLTKDGTLGKVAFVDKEPDKPATLNSGLFRCNVNNDSIIPKFLFYCLGTENFHDFIDRVKTHGTIKHLTQKWFVTYVIPVPPLPVQREIVRILDTFTEMNESLQSELTVRHQQYEYYRDKLLTFRRKEA